MMSTDNVKVSQIASELNTPEALKYCDEHKLTNFPEKKRQENIEKQKEIQKIKEEEAERRKKLEIAKNIIKKSRQEQENKLKELERKIILKFNVAGIKYHDIGKAIAFAKREKMFTPFDGANSNSLKNDPYQKYYETHLDGIISSANFDFETENEHDKNAIAVYINIKDESFKIGYVPKRLTSKVKDIINQSNNNKIALKVGCYLDGGKFKVADEDQNDFSDNPKLKIFTGTDDLKFDIELSDDNL